MTEVAVLDPGAEGTATRTGLLRTGDDTTLGAATDVRPHGDPITVDRGVTDGLSDGAHPGTGEGTMPPLAADDTVNERIRELTSRSRALPALVEHRGAPANAER